MKKTSILLTYIYVAKNGDAEGIVSLLMEFVDSTCTRMLRAL